MFGRLLYQSFLRQRRRKALAAIAIMLGVGVATAMIAVATDIGDKINRELRSYGANILVYPQDDTLDINVGGVSLKPVSDGAFLNESDLPKIKTIFWGLNIVGFAPMLPVKAAATVGGKTLGNVQVVGTYFAKPMKAGREDFATGVRKTNPWWKVQGAWPKDYSSDVLVGESLAQSAGVKAGDTIQLGGHTATVSGILSADTAANSEIIAPLKFAQDLAGKPSAVRQIYVSALTKPDDELAKRHDRSPDDLRRNPVLWDRWYCSPYVASIALQIEEVIPHAKAEQIRQVAQNEGKILTKVSGLMLLLALAALIASALTVSAAMATSVFERRGEIGLMKAIGASRPAIGALFLCEAVILAIVAGLAGYGIGSALAHQIGRAIFAAQIAVQPVILPIVMGIAMLVTLAGSAASIRKAIHLDPAIVLRGDA